LAGKVEKTVKEPSGTEGQEWNEPLNLDTPDGHTLQGKELQSETEEILPKVSTDSRRAYEDL
jgi:hypothetical protein